jgi:uncharacterized phiE125 gp8 family phage protein
MNAFAPVRTGRPPAACCRWHDAKAHIIKDADDALVTAYIAAAEAMLDGYSGILGRGLVTQTWQQQFSGFPVCGLGPTDHFRLPLGPLQEVVSISYHDTLGVLHDFTDFTAMTDAIGPMVVLNWNAWWPLTAIRPDAVIVTWTCGYGDDATAVPMPIIHAARLLVSDWYQNRENTFAERGVNPADLPTGVKWLLAPYRAVGC